jgi:stage II sporulation protein D
MNVLTARRTTSSHFLIILFLGIASLLFAYSNYRIASAETEAEIQAQKTQKQKELEAVMKEINSIVSSQGSLGTKIKELQAEKTKLETLVSGMKTDLDSATEQLKQQETDLEKLSEQYALNHALYYLETKKNAGVMLFESNDLRDFLDRMLYFSVQDKVIATQKEYIVTKQKGLQNQKSTIEAEQKQLQETLDDVNLKLSQLYAEQEQLNSRYRQSSSARQLLTSDLSQLSKKEQDIINKKAGSTVPGGNTGSSGSSGGTSTPGAGTVITTRGIDIFIGSERIASTDAEVKVRAKNDGSVLINKSCSGCSSPEIAYQGFLIFDKNKRRTFTGVEGTKTINVINDINVEQYLRGLGEMPAFWGRADKNGLEALKAQVVAARTYAFRKMQNYRGIGFDIYDTTDDQNYVGVNKIATSDGQYWDRAINETRNQAVVSGGAPISAFYSSSAGGHTISTEESSSFGGYTSYARASPDRYQVDGGWRDYGENVPNEPGSAETSYWLPAGNRAQSPSEVADIANGAIFLDPEADGTLVSADKRQLVTDPNNPGFMNQAKLAEHLGANSVQNKVGTITSVKHVYDVGGQTIVEYSKHTKYVEISGEKGTVRVDGRAFRTSYNFRTADPNIIWSSANLPLFDVKQVGGCTVAGVGYSSCWEFWSRGYGHRVGMSQYGAYGRARAGQDFKTILKAYYTGVDIVQYSIGRNVKVAITKGGSTQTYMRSSQEIEIYEGGTLIRTVPANTTIKIAYN